ncbi:MAG: hypothetical protein ACKV2T_19920 [Kofleriaceae bacterium]
MIELRIAPKSWLAVFALSACAAPSVSPHGEHGASVMGTNGSTLVALGATSGVGGFYQTDLSLELSATGETSYIDPASTVVVACIGPSFMIHDCRALKLKVENAPSTYPSRADPSIGGVVIVNCAVNGKGLPSWNDLTVTTDTWDACDTQLSMRGYTLSDVDVVLATASLEPGLVFSETYPGVDSAYAALLVELDTFMSTLATKLSNARAVYWRSLHYLGYDLGEPEAYEQGHALNTWLAANNDDGVTWHGWGVNAWSRPCAAPNDVENPEICYKPTDFKADDVHLVENKPGKGADKTSTLWYSRLSTTSWFP